MSEPTAPVTISLLDPNGQVYGVNNLLTFTPQNWYQLQTVTIQGIDEAVIEPGDYHTTFLKYTVSSEDSDYKDFQVVDQQINVIDRLIDKKEAITGVTEGLRSASEILNNLQLPLIGSGDGKVPPITEGLDLQVAAAIDQTENLTADKLEKILEKALHEFSFDLFGKTIKPFATVDVKVEMTKDDINVEFEVADSYNLFDFGLDADLGIPALGLKTEGTISSYFYYDFGLGLGFHKDFGFYLDTEKTGFDAGFKLILGEGYYETDKNGNYYFVSNSNKNTPNIPPTKIISEQQSSGEFTFLKDETTGKIYWDKNLNKKIDTTDKDITNDPILKLDKNNNLKLDKNLEATANLWFLQLDVANDSTNPSELAINFNVHLLDDLTRKINYLDVNNNSIFDYTDTNKNGKFDNGEETEPTGKIKIVEKIVNGQTTNIQQLVYNSSDKKHQEFATNNPAKMTKDTKGNIIGFAESAGKVLTEQEQIIEIFLDINGNGKLDSFEPSGKGDQLDFTDKNNPKLKFNSSEAKHTAADKNKNGKFDVEPAVGDPGQGKYQTYGNIRYFDFNLNGQLDYFEPSTNQKVDQFLLVKNVKDTTTTYYYFDSNNNGISENTDYRLLQVKSATTGQPDSWFFDMNRNGTGETYEKLEQTIVDKIYDSTKNTLKNGGLLTAYTTEIEGTFLKLDDGNRLSASEIGKLFSDSNISFSDLIQYNLSGDANLGLAMDASIGGDAAFPSLSTNLAINYPLFNYGNQEEAKEQKFTLQFNDVTLDLGSFITDFAKPIFESINDIFEPLRPVIDVLNADTGFLIKIFPSYDETIKGGNADGKLTLVEFFNGVANDPIFKPLLEPLLKESGMTYVDFQNSVKTAKTIIDLITQVDKVTKSIVAFEEGQNITFNFGNFNLNDIKGASTATTDATNTAIVEKPVFSTNPEQTIINQTTNPQAKNLLTSLTSIDRLEFEFLNPLTILRILLGEKDVDLVTFDVPYLNLVFPFTTGERPLFYVVPPGLEVTGRFDAKVTAKTDLFVGFDTHGLELWSEDGYSAADVYKIFDGFYLRDGIDANKDGILQPSEDTDEFTLTAEAKLSVALNVFIAKLIAFGGLEGIAGLDIVDEGERNGTNDGKIRFSEVGEKLSKAFSGEYGDNLGYVLTQFIDLSGKLDAFFGIEVKVGISFFGMELMTTVYKDELGRFTLLEFDLADLFSGDVTQQPAKPVQPTATIGNDILTGGSGDDFINANDGDDQVTGNDGNDNLIGGKGNDTLSGGNGNDTLNGAFGKDILNGDVGNDLLVGGDDNDNILGGEGSDQLTGDSGDDNLDGGEGADQLDGGSGNDTLLGNTGNDKLLGNTGNDLLTGGSGDDILTGGGGNDNFRFVSVTDNGYDTVTDFTQGQDQIYLAKSVFAESSKLTYNNGILAYENTNLVLIQFNSQPLANFSLTNDVVFF